MTTMVEQTVAAAMTRCPISVPVDAPFHGVAAILSGRRISAVPVVDEAGSPVGVVSEVDLMQAGLHPGRTLADLTAGEVMTSPVVTVAPGEDLTTAARRLADAGVRRLFVVEDGRLVGVLSRSDMLRGYLRDDDEVREQVERAVLELLPGQHTVVRASVRAGVVLLLGRVEYRSALRGVDALVREVPGVVEVRNRMSFLWNDETGPVERGT